MAKKLTKKASMKARDKRMGERPDIPAGTKIDLEVQRRTRYASSGAGTGKVTRKTVTVRVPVGEWGYHVKDEQGRRYRLTFEQGDPVRLNGDKADYDVLSSDFNAPETNPRKPKPLTVSPEHLEILTDAGFTPTIGKREIRKLMESDAWHETWEANRDEIYKTGRAFNVYLQPLSRYKTDAELVAYFKKYDKPGLARYRALRKAAHASREKMWKQRKKLVRALIKDMKAAKKRKKNPTNANFWNHYEATDSHGNVYPLKTRANRVITHALIATYPAKPATTFSTAVEGGRQAHPITVATAAKRAKHLGKNFGASDFELVEVVAVSEPSVSTNPTDDMDRGLILDEGEVFAKVGSHRQREKVYRVLGRKPQTYYNMFEGDKTAGASRFVVTEAEFQKLKDGRVKVTRSRLKTPNKWHPHIDFGGRDANPGTPPATASDLTQRLKF